MPILARPPLARSRATNTLLAACSIAACVPLRDLDDYRESAAGSSGAFPAASVEPEAVPTGAGGSNAERPPTPSGPLSGVETNPNGLGEANGGTSQAPFERLDAGNPPVPADAAPTAACAVGEQPGPNGRCFFFDAEIAAWGDARSACQERGAGWDLVSVRSAEVAEFLGATISAEAWIGASDAADEGSWVWIADGEPFWLGSVDGVAVANAYTNWNPTEPNGGIATNCARALPPGLGGANASAPWADLDCAQLRGAVCEGPG
jgi:hypothetical protein